MCQRCVSWFGACARLPAWGPVSWGLALWNDGVGLRLGSAVHRMPRLSLQPRALLRAEGVLDRALKIRGAGHYFFSLFPDPGKNCAISLRADILALKSGSIAARNVTVAHSNATTIP